MGYQVGHEIRKMEKEWEKLRVDYKAAGMSEEAIAQMYEFDKSALKSNRRFYEKAVLCHDYHIENSDGDAVKNEMSSQVKRRNLDALTAEPAEVGESHKFDWLHRIECERLHKYLANLPEKSKEIVTLLAFGNYSQKEVADWLGISAPSLSNRLSVIKRELGVHLVNSVDAGKVKLSA